jgi:hypothetical protein
MTNRPSARVTTCDTRNKNSPCGSTLGKVVTLRSLGDARLREVVQRYVEAWESRDVDAMVAILAEEATFAMPPFPGWFRGRDAVVACNQGHRHAGVAPPRNADERPAGDRLVLVGRLARAPRRGAARGARARRSACGGDHRLRATRALPAVRPAGRAQLTWPMRPRASSTARTSSRSTRSAGCSGARSPGSWSRRIVRGAGGRGAKAARTSALKTAVVLRGREFDRLAQLRRHEQGERRVAGRVQVDTRRIASRSAIRAPRFGLRGRRRFEYFGDVDELGFAQAGGQVDDGSRRDNRRALG